MDQWFVLNSGLGESASNMAWDEALLESMPRLGRPVLRFYGWKEPAATFGYFQKYVDVARWTPLRPLIRRPTGGGIVPHDRDWTYSIAVPTIHPWYALSAVDSYERVHAWIRSAFARLALDVSLAPGAVKVLPGQCFAGFEKSDVLLEGQKIAGAAQRRRKDGLLIQGSVQPPGSGLDRERWQTAMVQIGEIEHGITWLPLTWDGPLEQRAFELSRNKYELRDYNEKR